MIHQTLIDESLNRLMAHFKNRVVVRPPASAADLAKLEEMAGPLPRELTIFFSTCNGVRVQLETKVDTHICCVHEIEKILADRTTPAAAAALVLVRGTPDSASDWVVLERGPAYGCVIRWNQWTPGAELMASSFGRYFQCWVDYLIGQYDTRGLQRLDRNRAKFDAAYTRRLDNEIAPIEANGELPAWLHELDLVAQGGADFE